MTERAATDKLLSFRPLALGCAFLLLLCFALYDALLYADLRRELRGQALSTAAVSASALNMKISTGLRLGKELRQFTGLDRLLRQTMADLPEDCGIAVLLPDGSAIASLGTMEAAAPSVSMPILGRQGAIAGSTVIHLSEGWIADAILPQIRALILLQLALAGIAALLLWFFARKAGPALSRVENRKKFLALGLGATLLFMGISLFQSMRLYLDQYERSSMDTALRIGRILSGDLEKLLLVGVSLGTTGNMDQYLREMSASTPGSAIVLAVQDPAGRIVGFSHPEDTPLVERFSFRIPFAHGKTRQAPEARPWTVNVSITREAWNAGVLALALNLATLLVIALMVMLEGFLLLFLFSSHPPPGKISSCADEAGGRLSFFRAGALSRAILFIFVLAKDLPISFIPLGMGALARNGEMHPAILGLPVSAEIVMAALGIMLAGFWMKRHGPLQPMTSGIALAMLGNALSLLAPWPWLFVLARGLAGAGYGLALLPAQAIAAKEGRLAFLFAGVYAGSLCGGALGAMLAEHLGYAAVFGISALVMLLVIPLPRLCLGDLPAAPQMPHPRLKGEEKNSGNLRALFSSPAFLGLFAFSLFPFAFLETGLMNYFLPVFLHKAGAAQSDIGRMFMLNCLVIISLGPFLERLIRRRRAETVAVFMGALAGGAAVAGFLLLPPLAASLNGAFCLGLASCCNIPGQSGFLLRLPEARRLGVELSMSVLNIGERLGQMIGPLSIGALFAVAGVSSLALGGSLAAGLAGLGFLLVAGRERKMPASGSLPG